MGVIGRRRAPQALAPQRHHIVEAVENIGLNTAGLCFVENLVGGRRLVVARILQGYAGVFLLEGRLERQHHLVDDQRRVPDDLAFFLRRRDQIGVLRPRRRSEQQHRCRRQAAGEQEFWDAAMGHASLLGQRAPCGR